MELVLWRYTFVPSIPRVPYSARHRLSDSHGCIVHAFLVHKDLA